MAGSAILRQDYRVHSKDRRGGSPEIYLSGKGGNEKTADPLKHPLLDTACDEREDPKGAEMQRTADLPGCIWSPFVKKKREKHNQTETKAARSLLLVAGKYSLQRQYLSWNRGALL